MAWKEPVDYEELAKALTENFNILADEVQILSDRKTILEHKLRFAHEQYQYLVDKYAPADDSGIAKTLAQLQPPSDGQITITDRTGTVPLPSGQRIRSKQQTAIAIRDGRRAVQGLADLGGRLIGSTTSTRSISGTSSYMRPSARPTPLSTVLEQDFTVPGKKSSLLCPFTAQAKPSNPTMHHRHSLGASTLKSDQPLTPLDARDPTPHHSADPICAAMYAETMCSAPPSVTGSAAKCPIRYLDQHSPEEVARYFETHKHEIPRSHEVCVKRYQRNENDIRKLDAKYGSMVSMIQGLGQKHQPMLSTMEDDGIEIERPSNEMVENWAKDVSADGVKNEEELPAEHEEEREGRFDRPLREIRVGESPSRPWGISVPIQNNPLPQSILDQRAASASAENNAKPADKCPFGHDAKAEGQQKPIEPLHASQATKPPGKCPFGPGAKDEGQQKLIEVDHPPETTKPPGKCPFPHEKMANGARPMPNDGLKSGAPPAQNQPVFIQSPEILKPGAGGPQMMFTGPVFIGYPIEQAMALMQQWKATQNE